MLYSKLIETCKKIYSLQFVRPIFSIENISNEAIVQFARKNRLLHVLAIDVSKASKINKNQIRLNGIIGEYDTYFKQVSKSLKIVKKILANKPVLVIKTFSSYPHLTGDVDLLVQDQRTVEIVKDKIKKLKYIIPITTDINANISWTNSDEISHEYIWKNVYEKNIYGSTVFVPNANLDVLIRLAHMPFELAEIRLGELLHIFHEARHVNWDELRDEAQKMGWPDTFKRVTVLINSIHKYLYDKPLVESIQTYPFHSPLIFPLRLSYIQLFHAVLEKKAWKKIWGARYIVKDRLGL